MTAPAQAAAGLALVMGLALLGIRQVSAAAILLAVQCGAVAVAAGGMHEPIMAVPPLLLAAGIWLTGRTATLQARTTPLGGARLAIGAGVLLAVLCQSQPVLALPMAVILLSLLLATTRQHPLLHVMALIGIQNGAVLVACFAPHNVAMPAALPAVACLALPLPILLPILAPWAAGGFRPSMLTQRTGGAPVWSGRIDLALSLGIFAGTLLVPVDLTASVFAPLFGLDGVMRSWQRRNRPAMSLAARGLALLTSSLLVLAVCPPVPVAAWLAVLGAITTSLLPALPRLWSGAVLAFLGAGVALCGLLTLGPFIPGYFLVFAGFVAIAAVVPDLAVVLVILLLRLANQAPWPPAAEALGIAIALAALLVCAAGLRGKSPRAAVSLLQQSQASIAAFSLCLGQANGRFAALVLLILLILTRAAARVPNGPAAALAVAGLGGVPPLGVFPGLVLVVLATMAHSAWLLLPLGAAAVPMLIAGLPKDLSPGTRSAVVDPAANVHRRPRNHEPEPGSFGRKLTRAMPSVGWLPLALALLTGYCAPEALVRWWRLLTAGQG